MSLPSKRLVALTGALAAVFLCGAGLQLRDLRGDPDLHTKTRFTPRRFASAESWKQHRDYLRQRILVSAGLWPMPAKTPVRTVPFAELARQGYSVERQLIETLPGFYVGANIYKPTGAGPKRPAVLIAHGHWDKGRVEHTEAYSVPALGVLLARNGYVALAYDMVGYNDTRQVPHKFGGSEEEQLWSYGPLALQLWNSTRMLDYLAARGDVDPTRLAMTGASGGGTQTFLLAAVDDRVRVSIPVDMVSARFQGDDPCEMAPGLRIGTNNVEFAAAMAPRPMLLMSSAEDWTSQVPELEFPAIRDIYRLLNAAGQTELYHTDAEHGYNFAQRRAALQFLNKHFSVPTFVPEQAEFKEPPKEFLIGPDAASVLPGALDSDGVFRAWQNLLAARSRAMGPARTVELLRAITGVPWPSQVQFVATGGEGVLHRKGFNDVVPVKLLPGPAALPVIAVHGDGASDAQRMKSTKAALQGGAQVLVVELFGTGAADAAASPRRGDYLVFHHADDSNRVQDVATAASWLAANGARSARLLCGNGAEAVCRIAAAIIPIPLQLERENAKNGRLFIPGLLAAGYPAE